MGKIQVLDCTLRDGGYCNQWQFGQKNISKIISGLTEAGIDIIECGFLSENTITDLNITKFYKPEDLNPFISPDRQEKLYVAMLNYGEYNIEHLSNRKEGWIDGIRLAFHKKDLEKALIAGREIQEKGYTLFLQPMVSLAYEEEEFLSLIRECNKLKPYAFYIVDSFGVMKRKDLIRLFSMVEHNLCRDITIGFHSHNNMQLAYSNAQALVDIRTKHNLIIDCCVYGMGRGAGNLNTELFVEYLNDTIGSNYKLKPLLIIIDDILDRFYQKNYWGYSLPNYLSAFHNTHPNYASYLNDKHTLTVKEINDIFFMMNDEKRVYYDQKYIEALYLRYLSNGQIQEQRKTELIEHIKGKKILLIAPGKSSVEEKNKIRKFSSKEDVISVSINYAYPYFDTNFIFLSNIRRFKELQKDKRSKCIVTSNIPADMIYLQTEYRELLNNCEMVQDNAGMMAIQFFINCGVKEIFLAGMDGYSHSANNNFGDDRMAFIAKNAVFDTMNAGISQVLKDYSNQIKISFLTKPKYVRI